MVLRRGIWCGIRLCWGEEGEEEAAAAAAAAAARGFAGELGACARAFVLD